MEQTREPNPEIGPALRSLPPKWRRAVLALFDCKGNRTAALRAAGYTGKQESVRTMACRIFADKRVRAAVREECAARIDLSEVEVVEAVMAIVRDTHKKSADRLRAAGMIWDRSRPVERRLNVDVQHHLDPTEQEIAHYRALQQIGAPREAFLDRFGTTGLARVEGLIVKRDAEEAEVITAEYTDVTDEPAGEK